MRGRPYVFGMEMLDPQCFGHKPVLEIDDVSILVVGKLRLQTVTWFARLYTVHVVRED